MIEMATPQIDQPLADVFRANVERLLDERGLKAKLARRLGCSPANVTLFLKATGDVQLNTVQEWADALEVSYIDLLKKSDIDG